MTIKKLTPKNLKKPVSKAIDIQKVIKNNSISLFDGGVSLKSKNLEIRLLTDVFHQIKKREVNRKSIDSKLLKKSKKMKSQLLFIEKVILDANYKKASDVVFLDKNEVEKFIFFTKLFRQKKENKELKNISSKGSPILIELFKELSAYTDKTNIKENTSLFNNFLDIYDTFKRFKKEQEPSQKIFSLMLKTASQDPTKIKALKEKIVLNYS